MTRIAQALVGMLMCAAARGAPFADPTRPPGQVDAVDGGTESAIRVESILIAPDRRIAVVNGREVTVGSEVGGGRVVRIKETEVVVRGTDGSEETLKLFAPLVRRASQQRVNK